jgi:hypothetical protein
MIFPVKALVGPAGGQSSADCVRIALSKRGYFAYRRSTADFTLVGAWLLFGDKADRSYGHAVALRGDMYLDSEASSPVLLVDREPPPAAVREEVDLTLD